MTATPAAARPGRPRLTQTIKDLRRPQVALMGALGFSSGLPFLLTAATLGYWLRDSGASLKAIGFISWVGLAYTFKYLWSPIVDRVTVPWLGRLGRRRGWLLLTQLLLGLGLLVMAIIGPGHGLVALGAAAVFVAFVSATQDIAVDALRIESAETGEALGSYTGAFQLGYRIAVLVSDALILFAAQHLGWPVAYGLMALLMGVGVFATFKIAEPERADAVMAAKAPLWNPLGLFDAVAGPLIAFFRTWGVIALLMLLMVSLYRLPEFMMGPMATPFYHDLHLNKDVVGGVRTTFGLIGTLIGIALGGVLAASLGHARALIVAGVLQGLAIASFALLAIYGGDVRLFGLVMTFDNIGVGAAGVALVTYMSSLTSLGYTATQYALLTSAYTWVGKTLKGFSGAIIEAIQAHGHSQMDAYAIYFAGCGALGVPAILLCVWLAAVTPRFRMEGA
jgi:PAT family beta-lactamase induction signal transducer AmpG